MVKWWWVCELVGQFSHKRTSTSITNLPSACIQSPCSFVYHAPHPAKTYPYPEGSTCSFWSTLDAVSKASQWDLLFSSSRFSNPGSHVLHWHGRSGSTSLGQAGGWVCSSFSFFLLNLLKLLRLGEPDDGESLKQVGKDPAREYQELEEETCSYLICPSLC